MGLATTSTADTHDAKTSTRCMNQIKQKTHGVSSYEVVFSLLLKVTQIAMLKLGVVLLEAYHSYYSVI